MQQFWGVDAYTLKNEIMLCHYFVTSSSNLTFIQDIVLDLLSIDLSIFLNIYSRWTTTDSVILLLIDITMIS